MSDDGSTTCHPEPNLDLVHRMMIPGIWRRIKTETFPESWVVLSLDSPSTSTADYRVERAGGGPGSGLGDVVQHLGQHGVQFCGFRVAWKAAAGGVASDAVSTPPAWVHLCWIGEEASEETRARGRAQTGFMQRYFSESSVAMTYDATESTALRALHAMRTLVGADDAEATAEAAAARRAAIERDVQDRVAVELGCGIGTSALDWLNRDVTEDCTHYEGSMGEEAVESASKLDSDIPPGMDALTHALSRVEAAKKEESATDAAERARLIAAAGLPPQPPMETLAEAADVEGVETQARLRAQRDTLTISHLLLGAAQEQAAKKADVDVEKKAQEVRLRQRREEMLKRRRRAAEANK